MFTDDFSRIRVSNTRESRVTNNMILGSSLVSKL